MLGCRQACALNHLQRTACDSWSYRLRPLHPRCHSTPPGVQLPGACRLAQRQRMACEGYVGQENPLAAEYHCRDFDWAEHAAEVGPLVEAQHRAAGQPPPSVSGMTAAGLVGPQLATNTRPPLAHSSGDVKPSTSGAAVATPTTGPCIASQTSSPHSPHVDQHQTQQQQQQQQQQQGRQLPDTASAGCDSSSSSGTGGGLAPATESEWEVFYRSHPRARFFKERRYLLLEFPVLAAGSGLQHVVEIGAGCGSAVLPLLRSNPQAAATVTDISGTCLQQLQEAAQLLGMDSSRLHSFVADGTDASLGQQLAGCNADVALIMFTLSAVPPAAMPQMLRNAWLALRPGGVLCIRDHGLYDMVQLRIPSEQCIGQNCYRRGDGTLAYFFTPQELAGMAEDVGFEAVESDWVCVYNKNRKTGQQLKRVFVHGVFRRPAA